MKNSTFSIAVSTASFSTTSLDREILIEPSVLRDHPAGFNVFQVNPSVLEGRVNYDVPTFIRRGIRLSVAGQRANTQRSRIHLAACAGKL